MFIYISSTGTMNTSCVDAKLHSLGWKFEDLTYNYTSNNLSDCSYKNMIKTPSDEYFRCEQWNKASGFLNLNVKATAYFFMHGFLFFSNLLQWWKNQPGQCKMEDLDHVIRTEGFEITGFFVFVVILCWGWTRLMVLVGSEI